MSQSKINQTNSKMNQKSADFANPTLEAFAVLPEGSKQKYISAYETFCKWKEEKGITATTENVLIDYFTELAVKFKPTTLWTLYSMFRTTLNIHENIQTATFTQLQAYLKANTAGFQPKTASSFTVDEINKFLGNAPDHMYLPTKVALIMAALGNCQQFELYMMKLSDIIDVNTAIVVNVPCKRNRRPRTFTITSKSICDICRRYLANRPKEHNFLFLQYRHEKITRQRIGINSFCKMGRDMATFLQLPNPENYTGHSLRKSNVAMCAVNGIIEFQFHNTLNSTNDLKGRNNQQESGESFEFIGLKEIRKTPLSVSNKFEDFEDEPDDTSVDHSNDGSLRISSPIEAKPDIDDLSVQIHEPTLAVMKQCAPSTFDACSPYDEFHLFAMSVASQLRNMPLQSALRLQSKIQQMITEERLKLPAK